MSHQGSGKRLGPDHHVVRCERLGIIGAGRQRSHDGDPSPPDHLAEPRLGGGVGESEVLAARGRPPSAKPMSDSSTSRIRRSRVCSPMSGPDRKRRVLRRASRGTRVPSRSLRNDRPRGSRSIRCDRPTARRAVAWHGTTLGGVRGRAASSGSQTTNRAVFRAPEARPLRRRSGTAHGRRSRWSGR